MNSRLVVEKLSGLNEYNLNQQYFLHYTFKTGILKPKINNIELLDENYKPIPNENDYFDYDFYKAHGTEKTRITLRINFRKKMPEDYSPYININYSILGIKRSLTMKIILINNV